jgi:sec-independent protein translocase protein TatA
MVPGPLELMIIVFLILLFFGAKRLPALGRSMAEGMRELKQGAQEVPKEAPDQRDHVDPEPRDHVDPEPRPTDPANPPAPADMSPTTGASRASETAGTQ